MTTTQTRDVSEAELARTASRRGDRAAFEQLVRNTARLLFARFYLDTGDRHRSEDLVQETYLLAWRRVRELDDPAKFRAWLYQIAHSALVDSLRRESRKKRSAPLAPAGAPDDAHDPLGPSPIEAAERDEQRRRVLLVLREMPEEYRLPLMLRYLGDADYESISRQLALSNGALRGLLQRGMKMLKQRMKDRSET